jgi:hypothetical protein
MRVLWSQGGEQTAYGGLLLSASGRTRTWRSLADVPVCRHNHLQLTRSVRQLNFIAPGFNRVCLRTPSLRRYTTFLEQADPRADTCDRHRHRRTTVGFQRQSWSKQVSVCTSKERLYKIREMTGTTPKSGHRNCYLYRVNAACEVASLGVGVATGASGCVRSWCTNE